MSEYTFETAALKAVTIDAVKYNEERLRNSITPETIQAVAPIAWSAFDKAPTATGLDAVAIGDSAVASERSVVVGANSSAIPYSVVVGEGATASGNRSICLGRAVTTKKDVGITIGTFFTDTAGAYTCHTQGTGSITIGAGANTLNNGDIESSNSVTIGCKANTTAPDSITLGAGASNTNSGSILIGSAAKSEGNKALTITLGSQFTETTDAGDVTHTCSTEGTGSITIGAGANTINSTKTVDGVETTVESSNSVTIGCKAKIMGPDSVVIGASARGSKAGVAVGAGAKSLGELNVAIGNAAVCNGYYSSVAVGTGATTTQQYSVSVGSNAETTQGNAIAIGFQSKGHGNKSIALGFNSKAAALNAVAIGSWAKTSDLGAVVLCSTSEGNTKTQLYFSGANTPLAIEYEDGEAMMGYVVTDGAGNVMMDAEGNALVGTQKLSVLFPNNRGENAFTPAALNLDEGWTPKPMFRPSDLDLPSEEPEVEEPENIEPAKPLVYKPQPVYPIVEPEIEEINE